MTDSIKSWIEERRTIYSKRWVERESWSEAVRDWQENFPRALDALNAVLELHVPVFGSNEIDWCDSCDRTWPCETVQAIEGAISHE